MRLVAGVPMVEWVAGAMRNAGGDPIIIGRSSSLSGIAAIPELTPACSGPLVSLITAMDAAQHAARVGEGPAVALLAAVDFPLIKPRTLRFLAAMADENRAVLPVFDGELVPMLGLYPASLLPGALFACKKGGTVESWLGQAPVREVHENEWRRWGEDGSSFFAVRTAADLEEAERRI